MAHGDNPEDIYDEGGETEEAGYLEKEAENDPVKRQEKLLKRAEELMEMGVKSSHQTMSRLQALSHPPVPTSITISIRKISNGYITAMIPMGVGGYSEAGEPSRYNETFYSSISELIAQIGLEVVDFAASFPGCPIGPPGHAGVVGDSPYGGAAETPEKGLPGVGSDVPEGT